MASKAWKNIAHAAKIAGWISTMPWVSLQAPIEQILQEQDLVLQESQLKEWQARKNSELQMVTFAGTLIASAVTGSIQWSTLSSAHWLVAAAWYSTLLFSLVSVILAFYLTILLSNLAIHTAGNAILVRALLQKQIKAGQTKRSRWVGLFALQMPIMLLSYALIMYILGLSLMVIAPLWREPWGDASLVAICYCVFWCLALFGAAAVCHFIYVQNEEVFKFD